MRRANGRSRDIALALTFGAFAFWLAALAVRSIWADEFATNRIMERPDFASMLAYTPLSERRPPLYYVLLWWWQAAAGPSEFSLRYLSLIFSTLAAPLSWGFARATARNFGAPDRPIGLIAAWLTLTSPVIALFGVMIRNFPMMLATSVLSNWLFVRWINDLRAGTPRGARLSIAWMASTIVLVWTDYHAWAIIGAHMFWLLTQQDLRERAWKSATLAIGTAALVFLPLVPSLFEQIERAKQDADLSRDLVGLALRVIYPFFVFPFGETILPWHPAVLLAVPVVCFLVIRAFVLTQTRRLAWFCALLVFAPLAFNVTILTIVATDLTFLAVASRTLSALPPFLVLLAAGISSISPRARIGALGVCLIANVSALFNLWSGIEYHNPIYAVPLRALHADLSRRANPGDLIVSDFDIVYQYYYYRNPIPGTTLLVTEEENLPAIYDAIVGSTPRVWLFTFGRDRSLVGDRAPQMRGWLEAAGYVEGARECYAPTDPTYRALKERLIPRTAYTCKLVVTLYERVPR